MRTEADRWLGALFHGWVELVTLFLLLVAVLALLSWCWGRGLRPADRGPLVHAPMLLGTYGLVILLRQVQGEWWASLIVAFALLVGGLLSRVVRPALRGEYDGPAGGGRLAGPCRCLPLRGQRHGL